MPETGSMCDGHRFAEPGVVTPNANIFKCDWNHDTNPNPLTPSHNFYPQRRRNPSTIYA